MDKKSVSMNLLKEGYNGIQYPINSRSLNKSLDFSDEYNVVIFDDSILDIKSVTQLDFIGYLKLDYIK